MRKHSTEACACTPHTDALGHDIFASNARLQPCPGCYGTHSAVSVASNMHMRMSPACAEHAQVVA